MGFHDPLPPAPAGAPRARRRIWPWVLAGCVLIVLAVTLGAAVVWRRPPPSGGDAPSASPGPPRNARPGVDYVGDAACAGCHQAEAAAYREHPMGRSLAPVAAPAGRGPEAPSFAALGVTFRVGERGGQVFHKEVYRDGQGKEVAELEAPAAFVVGSGRQGRSYLVNREGRLFQSPVSWYAATQSWGLSPGFAEGMLHFDRPITEQCLFCHANRVEPVADTVNHYRAPLFRGHAIGCERCHGPGGLHGAAGDARDTIVNPARLEPALRDAVCEQCHLQGESRVVRRGRSVFDYRPGLPLHEFLAVFVRPPELTEGQRAISHPEQMKLSRCRQPDGGRLGCISCHDPHRLPSPEERVAFYRGRCLGCHGEAPCRLEPAARREAAPGDSCIDCHMPRGDSSNIAHLAVTDHRVVRDPARPPVPRPGLGPGGIPLLPFHGDLRGAADGEGGRDLGLAMIDLARRPCPEAVRREICRRAAPLLQQAVTEAPEDVAAWEALGFALWALGARPAALGALQAALARAPRREVALEDAARVAGELGREDALAYWGRLAEVNPQRPHAHSQRARLLAQAEGWDAAAEECRQALRLNPASVPARRVLVTCRLRRGEREQARAELAVLVALSPGQREELQRWFEEGAR